MREILVCSEKIRSEQVLLVDKDTFPFNHVMAAFN